VSPLVAAVVAGLFGLVFGSFANVVIHRVPRRQSLVRPGSACPSCGAPIAAHDNLPVLSWLVLRGRCRSCQAPIPLRYPAVELTMGVLWFVVALRLVGDGLAWAVPAYLALAFVCVVLTVIDATTRLLPNRITLPALPIVAGLLVVASLGEHEPGRLVRAAVAGAAVWLVFLALYLIYPAGMGYGDVKFVPTLGVALGWLSWKALVVGMFSAFLLGGLTGVGGMLLLRLSRKHLLPFGPWLATGALVGVLVGRQLGDWYLRAMLGA
jgi:leader peptidase (prepilin peptidase)/N-methyltransferase